MTHPLFDQMAEETDSDTTEEVRKVREFTVEDLMV